MLLSLVIPCHNSREFIVECLNSVKDFILPDCEAIIVDDGSSDDTVNLIQFHFESEIEAGIFRLLQISNSGPGCARNLGVASSRGLYIGFLDSDDILCPEYFEVILDAIEDGIPDIIQFNFFSFKNNSIAQKKLTRCHRLPPALYTTEEARMDVFCAGKWYAWARVYRKSVFDFHSFPNEKVFFEDVVTLPLMFFDRFLIRTLDIPLIMYRNNANGIVRNPERQHAATLFNFLEHLDNLPETNGKEVLIVQVTRIALHILCSIDGKKSKCEYFLFAIRNIGSSRIDKSQIPKFGDRIFAKFPDIYVRYFRIYRTALSLLTK